MLLELGPEAKEALPKLPRMPLVKRGPQPGRSC